MLRVREIGQSFSSECSKGTEERKHFSNFPSSSHPFQKFVYSSRGSSHDERFHVCSRNIYKFGPRLQNLRFRTRPACQPKRWPDDRSTFDLQTRLLFARRAGLDACITAGWASNYLRPLHDAL